VPDDIQIKFPTSYADIADNPLVYVNGTPLVDFINDQIAAAIAAIPSGGLLTAVVDIGPTTNNGPGDQTKGILNWSTVLIDLVAAPGVGKIHHVIAWEC